MNMVERVARALVIESWSGSGVVDGESMAKSGDFDPYYRDMARAAIAAMRAELEAWAYNNYDEGGGVVEAAIDAALKEDDNG